MSLMLFPAALLYNVLLALEYAGNSSGIILWGEDGMFTLQREDSEWTLVDIDLDEYLV